ncbi:uncharacterized protein LOC114067657 [Empidonax traillii]|uniref:uncharacterized protein LOC114067657 n=1 Tax=Empidonax traillii TaxID=164674 RepID=UPI000FFD3E0B|nr:uncharacterized protein LOC114067657 [Empidonax traillii]
MLSELERRRDEGAGNASPSAWMEDTLGPLGSPAEVSAGRTFPTPELIPLHMPSSHGRGPPTAKNQSPGEKKSFKSNEVVKEILKELQKGHGMDQGALWKAAFPKGSSGSVPGSADGREAMPGTGTRDEGAGNASPLDWLREVLEPVRPPAGVSSGQTFPAPLLVPHKPSSHGKGPPRGKSQPSGEKKAQESSEGMRQILNQLGLGQEAAGATTRAPKIQESTGRGFCRGTRCLTVIMASMLGGLLVIMLCCAAVWYWRVRKRPLSAPAPDQPDTSGRKSWTSHLCTSCPYPAALTQLKNRLLNLQRSPKQAPPPQSPVTPPSSPV